jgi:hypothetical protein
MSRARGFLGVLLVPLALLPFTAPAWAQCAMCRASLLHSQGGAELIEGLRQGIVLLLAIPLVIAASVLIRLKRAARTIAAPAPQQGMHPRESGC